MALITVRHLTNFANAMSNKITELFVRKEDGKGLSSNDYTTEEKTKLSELKNITVDSTLSNSSTNAIQNKAVNTALGSKVPTSRKINNKDLSKDVTLTASDVGAIALTAKGTNGGVAELDSNGKVPAAQLPSFVDDVIEGYCYNGKFYKESTHNTEIVGESGKIYIDIASGKTYRWSGTAFAVISDTIALGETSSTAYRGDRGKIAYQHSQEAHAPANAEQNVQSDWNETNTNSDAYIKNKPTIDEATDTDIDNIINGLFK